MLMLCMCPSTIEPDSFLEKYSSVENLTYRQIQCALYLNRSITDFLTALAARTHGFVFTRVIRFVQFSQRTPTLLSWSWPFHDMEPVPGALIGIMWTYCLAAAVDHTKLGGESAETKDWKKKQVQSAE